MNALDTFYEAGYKVLKDQEDGNYKVERIFVSDCGILFVRGQDPIDQLVALLNAVKEINKMMLRNDYMPNYFYCLWRFHISKTY